MEPISSSTSSGPRKGVPKFSGRLKITGTGWAVGVIVGGGAGMGVGVGTAVGPPVGTTVGRAVLATDGVGSAFEACCVGVDRCSTVSPSGVVEQAIELAVASRNLSFRLEKAMYVSFYYEYISWCHAIISLAKLFVYITVFMKQPAK